MKRPKRAGSLSHRELEECICKRVRKEERNEKEASRERTDTQRIRVGEGAQSNAQMIGECRGAIQTSEMTSSCRKSPGMNGI